MKNKGFTMVELLAVISLLAIIILIAVPTFGSVRDRTNQSIYESKIASVKAASEAYSEETGEIAFDVGTLIRQGKLEADNESGEYRNPVNGEDMSCYAVEVRYENLQYYANVHETSRCLTPGELQDLYGIVSIQVFDSEKKPLNQPIYENWYNQPIRLGYTLKKSEYASKIEQITWVGDQSITCTKLAKNIEDCKFYGKNNLLGISGSIQTMKVSLEMTFKLDNGAIFRDKTQKQILIDMEGPRVVSIEASPGMTNQSGKRVDIEMTDGNGSGLKEYRVVKVENEGAVPTCKKLDGYRSVEQSKMTEYLDNGWYYTCVRDNALNDNQDTVAQTKKQITGVDYSQVNGASLTVENQDENTPMKVKAKITFKGAEDINKLKMCVSNSGHLKDCSWKPFNYEFDWSFPGHADCNKRTLYVSISDEVGNITNLVNNVYKPHSVAKFDGNGVTLGAADAKKSVCYDGSYSIPTAIREGHTLSGWFTAKSGGTQLKKTDKVNYDGVRTYYARWTANKYYLDLNGLLDGTSSGNINGYGTADVYIGGKRVADDVSDYWIQHSYGTTYEIKDIKNNTGHTYEGVSNGDTSGKVGVGGKDTNVQLQYRTNTYTVSWDGNGGSVTKNGATSVKYNNSIGTLGTASRAGYTLEGWYTETSGGTKIDENTKVTENVTYYAHWKLDEPTLTEVEEMEIEAGVGLGNNVGILFQTFTDSGKNSNCGKKTEFNQSHVNATVIKVDDHGNLVKGNEITITSGSKGMGWGSLYAVRLSDTRVLIVGNSSRYIASRNNYMSGATAAIVEVDASRMTAKVVGEPQIFATKECRAEGFSVHGLACGGNSCRVPISTTYMGANKDGYSFENYEIKIEGNNISAYNTGEGGYVTGDPMNRAGRWIHQASNSSFAVLFTLNNGYVMSNTIGYTHGGNSYSSDMLRTLHVPLSYYPTGYYANVPTSAVRWYNALDESKYDNIINNELHTYIQNNGIRYYPVEDFKKYVNQIYGCCDYQYNSSKYYYNYGCKTLPKLAAIGGSSFLSVGYEYDKNARGYVNLYRFYTYPENCRNGDTSAACITPTVKEMNWNVARDSSSKLISLGRCVADIGKKRSVVICY